MASCAQKIEDHEPFAPNHVASGKPIGNARNMPAVNAPIAALRRS